MESDSYHRVDSSVRRSTASSSLQDDIPCTPIDLAITQLVILGIWMHIRIPEISNGTVLREFCLGHLATASSGSSPLGSGFTASVDTSEVYFLNGATKSLQKASGLSKGSEHEPMVKSAVKRIRTWAGDSHDSGMAFLKELKVLISPVLRKHPNIISLISYDWEVRPGQCPDISPVITLERADAGSLAHTQTQMKLSYPQKRNIMLDVSRGLSGLHSVGVIHSDLKSENVLLFRKGNSFLAKLCDFGFSIFAADADGSSARLYGGTEIWMAPECIERDTLPIPILNRADVYSLGLLFWRLFLDGCNPFQIKGLTEGRDAFGLKVSTPSLLVIAQFSLLLLEDSASNSLEMFQLLASTIQRDPLHRSLRDVLVTLGERSTPVTPYGSSRISSKPHELLDVNDMPFDIRNVRLSVRQRVLKHILAGAKTAETAVVAPGPGFCPVSSNFLLYHCLGDGGMDLEDDAGGVLRLMTECAERTYIPMQATIVRMYNYFDIDMPERVAMHANNYLATGVANGSLTAIQDYTKYWSQLKYKTQDDPESFLFNLRTLYCAGVGYQLDRRIANLMETATLERQLAETAFNKSSLQTLYGLERGNNLLHGASMLNIGPTVEILIKKFKADVNEQNQDGDTPLLLACRHGHFTIILMLLVLGARPNIANKLGETPLHWVMNVPDEPYNKADRSIPSLMQRAIKMLCEYGGHFNAKSQMFSSAGDWFFRLKWAAGTPLHRAVSRRNLAAAKYLLEVGADPLATDGSPAVKSVTPLDIAMHHHNAPMLELLLDHCKYDINVVDEYGTTLFSRAISSVSVMEMIIIHGKGYPQAIQDTMELLLQRGWNPGAVQITTSMFGLSPPPFRQDIVNRKASSRYEHDALYLAAYFEKLAWVKFILGSPKCMTLLDINHQCGPNRITALHESIKAGRKSMFKILLAAGADPSTNVEGNEELQRLGMQNSNTSLHLVASQGDPDLFFTKRLLGYALDVDRGDFYGTTPLALAILEDNFHIASSLIEAGADINKLIKVATAPAHRGKSILEMVIAQNSNQIRRLQYLLSPPDADPDESVDNWTKLNRSWLSRPGPPPSLYLGTDSTALHYFLDTNGEGMDSTFAACFRILLDVCKADHKLLSMLARARRWKSESTTNETRQTPLHLAAEKGNVIAVQMLLEAGANRSAKDDRGLLPADIAAKRLSQGSTSQCRRKTYQDIICLLNGLSIPKYAEHDTGERLSSRLRELML